ncbi:hypothetical protein AB0I60_18620 [Actinosynnema sp. NPDC050436]|uniref:hypothetical protein n=1 Tax=Actinosynnema sp. NPDC050436 TaxID=3155659 RepID=UPI003402DD2F
MSRNLTVAAAITIATPRLQSYLRAPVPPASAWAEHEWVGLCEAWSDAATRRRYRAEPAGAVAECDRWVGGDHADLLRGLDDDGGLTLGHDGDSGALVLDLDTRVDFPLPSPVWAFTVLRGVAAFLADDDSGLVEVTVDWAPDVVLMQLSPGRSVFLGRGVAPTARARDAEFDARCAVSDTDRGETASEVVDRVPAG